MKRIELIIGLFLFSIQPIYSMGFGDWGYTTKHRTSIVGDGGVIIENRRNRIYSVKKWYYYQDHIIGINSPNKYNAYSYFILNEINGEIKTFEKVEEWRFEIKENELKPIFTRWYSDHFNGVLLLVIIYSICYPFVSIPIYVLLFYLLYKFMKEVFLKERFDFKKPFTQIFIFLCLIIGICTFFSHNVQSF